MAVGRGHQTPMPAQGLPGFAVTPLASARPRRSVPHTFCMFPPGNLPSSLFSSRCHCHSSAHQQTVAVLVMLAAVTKFHGLGGLKEGFLTVLEPGEESTITMMAVELLVGTRCPTCQRPSSLCPHEAVGRVGGCRLFLF